MNASNSEIEQLCLNKEQELIEKYFGNLIREAAYERLDTIGEYTPDLPLKVENEYKAFLEEIWKDNAPDDMKGTPLNFEEWTLRDIVTEDDREAVARAHKKATTVNLWERITNSNYKDVAEYKGLLKMYTEELLATARLDFMEEITGNHISNKAFDDGEK